MKLYGNNKANLEGCLVCCLSWGIWEKETDREELKHKLLFNLLSKERMFQASTESMHFSMHGTGGFSGMQQFTISLRLFFS